MKFVTYEAGSGPCVGRLEGGCIFDVGYDGDMVSFITAHAPVHADRHVPNARLLAPIRPRSLRDFSTFESHLINVMARLNREVAPEWYTGPSYYKGMPDTVLGPDCEIPWPHFTDRLDHELELAAVVGREGKNISAAMAPEYIFGYTIWNDVSARDVLARELPLALGPGKAKDWDGSNVLGPCIATSDEINAGDLRMTVRVNGETWGEDNSRNMHYEFGELLAYASQEQTLFPGEVFGSGTACGGSGLELNRWLQEGDVVELEIDGIGVLRNRIGRKGAKP